MSERIAVFGDVHGNRLALEAALRAARREGCDQMVFLGDLLNYGVENSQVVQIIRSLCGKGEARLIRGNHDAIHLGADESDAPYMQKLPAWIRESIEFTREQLAGTQVSDLPFEDEIIIGSMLLSHANPYGRGDWRYLNSADDCAKAALELQCRSFSHGVFGHTHRPKLYRHAMDVPGFRSLPVEWECTSGADATWVVNAGAIGQPRDAERIPYVLLVESGAGSAIKLRYVPFQYDVAEHVQGIAASSLSDATKQQLISYFHPRAQPFR